jgi:glycosyltransferase involved in cell wall biosynthesis
MRVLSVAHTAVSRGTGRLRYHPFAGMPDLDVHLVAPSYWREFGREITADPGEDPGVTMHLERVVLPSLPVVGWYLHVYPTLGRLIRRLQPDVIHLWEEPWSAVALQAALFKRNAALVLEVDQNILKRLAGPFEWIRRFVLRHTTLVLSRSSEATEVVRACGFKGAVSPIGYGVDDKTFTRSPTALQRHADAPLRLCYFGRLIEEKGLDDALLAMRRASAPVVLKIMGSGPYEGALRQRVRDLELPDRVSFQGWGSPQDVAQFIGGADLSILLTRTTESVREQFGRAIIESQSCGVPVIGSACGAIPHVLGPGGWIVPERSPAAIAHLLEKLYANPETIRACGDLGRANVANRFTYEKTAQALAEAWKRAASTKVAIAVDSTRTGNAERI